MGLRTKRSKFFCGGAIVGPKVVFTAAHCATIRPTSFPRKGLHVFVGADRIDDPNAKIYAVKHVLVHPHWNYFRLNYDFAILILKKPIEFSDKVKPIPVTRHDYVVGKEVVLSGYGRDEFGVVTGALRTAKMQIAPRKKCRKKSFFFPPITKAMICLESLEEKSSACHVSRI